MHAKDPYPSKYKFLINKRESTGLKHFNDPKVFIEYSKIWKMFIKILKNKILVKNVNIDSLWWCDCWYD